MTSLPQPSAKKLGLVIDLDTNGDIQPDFSAEIVLAGDPVALVYAETEQAARAARSFIKVTYEDLPGVFDPRAAREPGAPLVHLDAAAEGRALPRAFM